MREMTTDTAIEFRQAADRALDFLADHVDDDGRSRIDPNDPGLHFKLPYVFAYGDRRWLALRVLNHIERNLLADDGSFNDEQFNGPASAFLYQAGWLAWSSAALGRFDLARRVARRAAQEQDPNLGGFWNETHQGREQGLLNSSSAAAGCAAAGELEAAELAASFMARLLELQPEVDRRFHFGLDAEGKVITDSDAETGRNHFDLDGPCRPAMFATAIASLTWLGRQTGDGRHFDLARAYANVILSHRGEPWTSPFASKTGWAALQLNVNRPDPALTDYAESVGQRFFQLQQEDGSVDLTVWPGFEGGAPLAMRLANLCDWSLTALALANGSP